MPQYRDPIVERVSMVLGPHPYNILRSVKPAQPTRQKGVLQAVMFIQVVSLCNFDNASGVVDIGFMVGKDITWSRTVTLGAAKAWTRNHVNYTLTSDYQIVARFNFPTGSVGNVEGDHVQMNINGYYLEPYTSP